MIIERKEEIFKRAAESNHLSIGQVTPVQFIRDYYNEDWHIKAGTLAYVIAGTKSSTTITETDGKESVECRIIAEMATSNDRMNVDAIAFDDGTLLLKGEKFEPCHYKELFAPPSDGDWQTMRTYVEVNAKIAEIKNTFDDKFLIAGGITIIIGLVLIGFAFFNGAMFLTPLIIGSVCFAMGFLLPVCYIFVYPAMENRKLSKEKKKLKEELKRRDAENVKAYEKGMI